MSTVKVIKLDTLIYLMRVIYVNVIGLEITKIWTGVLIWNLNKNKYFL
jgi:hypothetical protein